MKERAKSDWECLLQISIYSISKFWVTSKTADFDCWYIGTHTKEKPSKISNTEVAILLSHQNTLHKLPSWVLWSPLFLIKPSDRRASKYFILARIWQKLDFLSFKYVTYTQPIWVALSKQYIYSCLFTNKLKMITWWFKSFGCGIAQEIISNLSYPLLQFNQLCLLYISITYNFRLFLISKLHFNRKY